MATDWDKDDIDEEDDKRFSMFTAAPMALLSTGGGLIVWSLFVIVTTTHVLTPKISTCGVVVHSLGTISGTDCSQTPYVAFQTATGEHVQAVIRLDREETPACIGDTIRFFYDPKNPKTVWTSPSFDATLRLWWALLYGIACLAGGFYRIYQAKHARPVSDWREEI